MMLFRMIKSRRIKLFSKALQISFFLFSGKEVWATLDGVSKDLSGPQNLTDFGLPNDILKLDAAFVWGKNKKTYFFLNNVYWRYDEMLQKMDEGYPKGIDSGQS